MSSAKNLQVSWKCEQYKALKLSAVQSNLSLSICILFAYTEPWSPKAKKNFFWALYVLVAVMDTAE